MVQTACPRKVQTAYFSVYYLHPACERRAPRSGEQGPGNRSQKDAWPSVFPCQLAVLISFILHTWTKILEYLCPSKVQIDRFLSLFGAVAMFGAKTPTS